jgi:hypothetical protein
MGAWAEYTFGNDTACDWAGEFRENPSLAQVEDAIDAVLAEEEYLDSDEACCCLAACEVIARLKGNWGLRNPYSEKIDNWVLGNPQVIPESLVARANSAIDRILGPESELPQLWDDGGRNENWHKAVEDLRDRINR